MDLHPLQIPASLTPGEYEIRVGMYDLSTMQRLPIKHLDGMMEGDFLTLGTLTIVDGKGTECQEGRPEPLSPLQ